MKKYIHLNDKAKEIVATLNKEGFNGVYIAARYQQPCTEEEVVPDEMTKASYKQYVRDLAYFTAEPDFYSLTQGYRDNDYVDVEVDTIKFHRELMKYIQEEVGSDVTIGYREGCSEYELIRKKTYELIKRK